MHTHITKPEVPLHVLMTVDPAQYAIQRAILTEWVCYSAAEAGQLLASAIAVTVVVTDDPDTAVARCAELVGLGLRARVIPPIG